MLLYCSAIFSLSILSNLCNARPSTTNQMVEYSQQNSNVHFSYSTRWSIREKRATQFKWFFFCNLHSGPLQITNNPMINTLTVILAAKHWTYFAVVHGWCAINLQVRYLAFGISSKNLYTVPPPNSICERKWSLKNGTEPNWLLFVYKMVFMNRSMFIWSES